MFQSLKFKAFASTLKQMRSLKVLGKSLNFTLGRSLKIALADNSSSLPFTGCAVQVLVLIALLLLNADCWTLSLQCWQIYLYSFLA